MNVKIGFVVYITAVLVLFSFLLPTKAAAFGTDNHESPFVRYPALSPDGAQIAFCFQGDIWTVPFGGGEAKRLTIHSAYDALPKWNSDGSRIAFSSNRFGNELYKIEPPSSLMGLTFFEVMCELKKNHGILCLAVENRGSRKLIANPDAGYRLGLEDELVVIATTRPELS